MTTKAGRFNELGAFLRRKRERRCGESRLNSGVLLPPLSDSHSDDFDPASTKSKYGSLDFDSLLREAQRSLRR